MNKQQKLTIAVLISGAFLSTLNQTLLNPALPSIMTELNISATKAQYLVSVFTLVNAIIVAISAFLMDKLTTRKVFISVFGLFLIGSLLAGWGADFVLVLAGRILQAICTGVMMPLSMTVLLLIYPKEKRGSAMGLSSFVIMFAPAIGPVISGVLTDTIGWRIMFLIMAALAAAVILFAAFGLKNFGETKPVILDKPSVALSSLGLLALLYGFSSFGSPETIIIAALSVAAGIAALLLFSKRQLKLKEPFLQIRVLADKQFRGASIVLMLISASLTAAAVTLPIYIQTVRGLTATISGTVMMPGAILGAIAGYFAGNLCDKFGPRVLAIIGVLLVTAGSVGMALFGMNTPVTVMIAVTSMRTVGLLLANTPITIWGIEKLPDNILHHGNAVSSTLRQVGSSLGVALTVSLMSFVAAFSRSLLTGISAAYWLSVGIALVCFVMVVIKIHSQKKLASAAVLTDSELDVAMKKPPYTLLSNDTLATAIDRLIEYKTSGLPIVDDENHIVGYISDGDILRYLSKKNARFISGDYAEIFPDRENIREKAKPHLDESVMDIATGRIISVEHTTTLSEVCRIFLEQKLNKLPVTQNGRLIGTISRGDIMRLLMRQVTLN